MPTFANYWFWFGIEIKANFNFAVIKAQDVIILTKPLQICEWKHEASTAIGIQRTL